MVSPQIPNRIFRLPLAVALVTRLIQGGAVGFVVFHLSTNAIFVATALCGAAFSVGLDAWLQRRSFRAAVLLPLLLGALCFAASFRPGDVDWQELGAAVLLGLTAGTGWSASTVLLRASVSTVKRWKLSLIHI